MTTTDLIALLAEYPEDTPVFDGRGFDLHASSVTEMAYDDWDHATRDPEDPAYEVPARGIGVSIGRRF
jgi:hypothetical protein